MGNTSGQAYSLMVMTPVLPGREAPLQEVLRGLPTGEDSPLARMGSTHFARWLVVHDLVYQGPPQQRDSLKSPYLIFVTSFDGDLDDYLAGMRTLMAKESDAIWSNCVGYPGSIDPHAFSSYLKHNQIESTVFVSAYPNATVADVRASLLLRRQLTEFAIAAQSMDPSVLRREFLSRFSSKVA